MHFLKFQDIAVRVNSSSGMFEALSARRVTMSSSIPNFRLASSEKNNTVLLDSSELYQLFGT
jgi:hypothetical protein